ncbi:MAG: glycosyltransferase [Planctomycetota bacterium]
MSLSRQSQPNTSLRRVVVNGISAGTGGGLTVAREIAFHLAAARNQTQIELLLRRGNPLHAEAEHWQLPGNVSLLWAPTATNKIRARYRYEDRQLRQHCADRKTSFLINLNGMVPANFPVPTLAHFQDPFPFRPEAWSKASDRVTSFLKRRGLRVGLKRANVCGFTSQYLKDLIEGYHGIHPEHSFVFHNGIPSDWLRRRESDTSALHDRPMQICTVSNVDPYKRQELVIRALAKLAVEPDFKQLRYVIAGGIDPAFRESLETLTRQLDVEHLVDIRGRVSDAEVTQTFRDSRAMVLMSVCESFGIPAIEAMSFGTPAVLADCCAIPEIAGPAGILVDVDDVEMLADQLRNVLTNTEMAQRHRALGFERIQKFNWLTTASAMAEQMEAFLKR